MDLAGWVRARRVRDLLDLIDQLGPRSRYRTALVNDPEYAAAVAAAREANRTLDDDQETWTPEYSDYDLHAQQLHDIRQILVHLVDVTLAAHKQKPSGIKAFPSPVTAIDRAAEDLRAEGYIQSVTVFAPKHAPPTQT